jgi:hypothetical protein
VTTIYTGTTLGLIGEFVSLQGNAIDPTTITLRYQDPAGVTTTVSYPTGSGWSHPITGTYIYEVEVNDEGNWKYSYEGTGACDTYGEAGFVVFERGF